MVHWGFFFMEQLNPRMTKLYTRGIILYVGSNADIGCISATNRFLYLSAIKTWNHFFFNLLNEVTHRQNKGSAEKIFSLKVTLDITKLVSSSGRPHSIFWLHSSYIATVFSPHFCFLKSHLSEPVTRLNWYFWLLRLKYPAPVIWAISLSNSLLGDSFHTQLEDEFIYKRDEKQEGLLYP